jgi:CBS domain-containing protein
MFIRELMTRDVFTLSEDHRLYHAVELMKDENIRHIVITGYNNKIVGIISDRDLKFVSNNLWNRFKGIRKESNITVVEKLSLLLTVDEVMTHNVISCLPSQSVKEAVGLMLANKISALPIVSPKDPTQILGIVTITDILSCINWMLPLYLSDTDVLATKRHQFIQ